MHLLEAMGKQVTVAFADPIPSIFQSLPGADRIVATLPSTAPDCAVLLECGSVVRSGFPSIPAAFSINIDHHQSSQNFADFNWIDPDAAAVGAMIYDVARAAAIAISAEMATCLYTAVLTDTGAFMFSSTTAETFALAEHLVRCGASPNQIAEAVYFNNAPNKLRLLGIALRNLQIELPVAWSSLSLAEVASAGASVEDTEGIVNYLIGLAGVRACAFLREVPGNEFRMSLRSKGTVDVARVAEGFKGGGHRNASGCTGTGTLAEVTAAIIPALQQACAQAASPPDA